MNHHSRVGKSISLPLCRRREEGRQTRYGRHAYHIGCDRTFEELHGVIDRKRRSHGTTRAVDIKVNLLLFVLVLQVEHLHHCQVGTVIVDRAFQENNPVLQQQIPQRHLTLPRIIARSLEPGDGMLPRESGRTCRLLIHAVLSDATVGRSVMLASRGEEATAPLAVDPLQYPQQRNLRTIGQGSLSRRNEWAAMNVKWQAARKPRQQNTFQTFGSPSEGGIFTLYRPRHAATIAGARKHLEGNPKFLQSFA